VYAYTFFPDAAAEARPVVIVRAVDEATDTIVVQWMVLSSNLIPMLSAAVMPVVDPTLNVVAPAEAVVDSVDKE
jgi:hypothetical protein